MNEKELKELAELPVKPTKEIYEVGEPEFIGNIPIRTEVEVLPADEPKQLKLGWVVIERNGGEIWFARDLTASPITTINGIHIGDEIVVPTLFGPCMMHVTEIDGNKGTADSGKTLGLLEFGTDDRNCWTSSAAINKRALSKLNLK